MNRGQSTATALPRPAVGESRLVTRAKVTINYFVRGAGETVVLLPAFGRAASDYNEVVAALNDAGYRSVAVEQRGVGKSSSPSFPRASVHDFAADVVHVLEDLGGVAGGQVHLVGRAFGARVARAVVADHPHLVRSVVLLAGGGLIGLRKWPLLRYALGNLWFMPLRWRRRAVARTLYAPGNEPPAYLVYRHSPRAVRRQLPAARTPLAKIGGAPSVPILWIIGQEDALVPVEDAYALRDQFPERVRLVIVPGAGHALVPEQPEAVLRAMTAFLREHALTPASA